MRKLIAGINMTLDGYCDHTAISPDDEVHEHYNQLLRDTGLLIYGRITFQMMESHWPAIVKEPTGNKPIDDFAKLIDTIPKLVYSRTLKNVDWKNTILKREIIKEELLELKKEDGKDMLVGSPSLIIALSNLHVIDEYQIAVHPVVVGKGMPLFKNISGRMDLSLLKTKIFAGGAVIHYYEPKRI